jgi:GNAT superfamily N-acetyltransferase
MNIDLRLATESLIPDILDMMSQLYAYDKIKFEYHVNLDNLKQFLNNPGLGRIWVIYDDNHAIGYLILVFSFSFEHKGEIALINEFYVEKEYLLHEVSIQTLEHVEMECSILGIRFLQLEVDTSHDSGKNRFFSSCFEGESRVLKSKRL